MTHYMRLNNEPFQKISEGIKTIELRLYDEKRKKIRPGDIIVFTNTADETQTLTAEVERLHIYPNFDELYADLPLLKCGYTEENVENAAPSDMEYYYSKEMQRLYGVVGIEIDLK